MKLLHNSLHRIHAFPCFLFAVFFLTIILSGCGVKRPPLVLVEPGDMPYLLDDGNREQLLSSLQLHRGFLETLPANQAVNIGGREYSLGWLKDSLDTFSDIVRETPHNIEMHSRIAEQFDIYQASGREGKRYGEMLVTGYYEPTFPGSLTPTPEFRYPLYRKPPSLIELTDSSGGDKRIGRLSSTADFVDFWTREEIEQGDVLNGSELVYLKDRFDAYLIHIQGSARIRLPDNSIRTVRYAGNNGHEYMSIGKLLVDENILPLKQVSTDTIREYLDTHPQDQNRILYHNPRFIFFRFGVTSRPEGNLGIPLTPGRSIAIDQNVLPRELVGLLQTSTPRVDINGKIIQWEKSSFFVLPQDRGAAIQGPGRVDLFWGDDMYAKETAGNMKEVGELFFFVKKGYHRKGAESQIHQ